MKRLIFLLVLALNAWASYSYDFEVDGIQYDLLSLERQTVKVVNAYKVLTPENTEKKLVIPSCIQVNGRDLTVTEIGADAVRGGNDYKNFRSVILPATIETISSQAFWEQEEIEEIVLPSSLKTIGRGAFSDCKGLKKVTFNDGLQSIGMYAFNECVQLEEIRLPQSVRTIEDLAFRSTAISSFIFPDSLTSVKGSIFADCKNLEYVDLEPLKNIGKLPNSLFAGSCVKRVIIPDWATYIPSGFVYECSNIEKFQFGENIERIDMQAFDNCSFHCTLVLPEKLTEIGHRAFYHAKMPGKLIVPPTVVTLGYNIFEMSQIDSLVYQEGELPIHVQYNPYGTTDYIFLSQFSKYLRLDREFTDEYGNIFTHKTHIVGNIIEIGKHFLKSCPQTIYGHKNENQRLTFLEGVEELNFKYDDYHTQNILLPSTLHTIQAGIFTTETDLGHIDCRATIPPVCEGKIVADKIYISATLTVPVGSKEAYQQAEGWKHFWNIRETEEAEFDPEHQDIRDVKTDDAQWFTIQDGSIHAIAPIDVFSVDGQLLRRSATGQLSDIPKGCYIIRCGARTAKVNVAY